MIIIYNLKEIIYKDAKQITFFPNNKNCTIENIDISSQVIDDSDLNIKDGVYAVDKGDGWVRGLDEDIVVNVSGTVGPGKVSLSQEVEDSTKIIVEVSTSIGFNAEFVSATLEAAYEYTSAIKNTINVRYTCNVSENKKAYGVLYKHFYREEVIRVKDKKVVDKAVCYRFSGVHPLFIEYPINGYSNFRDFKYVSPKCLIGEKNLKTSMVDTHDKIENAGTISNSFVYTIGSYNIAPEYINIYFKILTPGLYNITSGDIEELYLYEVVNEGKTRLERLGYCFGPTFSRNSLYRKLESNTTYIAKIKPRKGVRSKIGFYPVTNNLNFLDSLAVYDAGSGVLQGTNIRLQGEVSVLGCKFDSRTTIGTYISLGFYTTDSSYNVKLYKITLENNTIKSATKVHEFNTYPHKVINFENKWGATDFIAVVTLTSKTPTTHTFRLSGHWRLIK